MKNKFKIGDKVYLKESVIKWYLSDYGQEAFTPPSGKLDKQQELDHDLSTMIMLTLGIKNDIPGVVLAERYLGTTDENFKVLILGKTFNIEPKDLRKA